MGDAEATRIDPISWDERCVAVRAMRTGGNLTMARISHDRILGIRTAKGRSREAASLARRLTSGSCGEGAEAAVKHLAEIALLAASHLGMQVEVGDLIDIMLGDYGSVRATLLAMGKDSPDAEAAASLTGMPVDDVAVKEWPAASVA